ncbi:ANTAR domain-containing response regulator [Carboxydothermus pertinax]|uniref:Stage 0 sporulation protein A homolog n=1 Tax=Carboxydothermus pertinax TaxID=870242 RepID=A0A1L8CSZ2_9THEO|nr:ANTAR domain-containing protein [Carboxydothermus pertinax]GAV21939.1 Fis family transcriptional regulator [Carboxydothermus pertinax]
MFGATVIIASADSNFRNLTKAAVKNLDYIVVGECVDGPSALKMARNFQPDMFIIDDYLTGVPGREIAKILSYDRQCAVVLAMEFEIDKLDEFLGEMGVVGIVLKPLEEEQLIMTVQVTEHNFQRIKDLEKEIEDLKDALETRKLVEKAKGILMESLGISEKEAFRKIQKQSMDKRISMRAVAEAIILAFEVNEKK